MKLARSLCLATLTAIGLGVSGVWTSAEAVTFDQAEVDQTHFLALASPYANGSIYRLAILEQLSDSRPCWQETGGSSVDPLLLNFDFTNVCARNPDSNGYSLRVGGQDLGLQYDLRVEKRSRGLVLLAVPIGNSRSPALEVGRASGSVSGYTKISLNPGWRFTRRVYQGQPLGHIYLTNDRSLTSLIASAGSRSSFDDSLSDAGSSFDDRLDSGSGALPRSRRPIASRPTRRQPGVRPTPIASIDRPITIPVPRPISSRSGNDDYSANAGSGSYDYSSGDSYDSSDTVGTLPSRPVVGTPGNLTPPRNGNLLPVPSVPPPPPGMPEVGVPRTPGSNSGSGSWNSSPAPTVPPSQLASQLGFSYRVVVQSSSPDVQTQVKAIAPDAFRTVVDGQTVIQAGLFRQLEDAEAFQQNLNSQNLQAVVVPVSR